MQQYAPLLGETAWHSLTADPSIEAVSLEHFQQIKDIVEEHWHSDTGPNSFLEVACYAHTTGYHLHREYDAAVTLVDISASTLRLGRDLDAANGPTTGVDLYAADFHELPFRDGAFDVVYISAALHHTWNWTQVLGELQRVTAPGGLLILSREPCARLCCLYRFRTNRLELLTPFEQSLYEAGILRTIAEPFPGSRPESLFGMVENQAIPVREMLAALQGPTEIVNEHLDYETTMSEIDRSWLGLTDQSHRDGIAAMKQQFSELCQTASQQMDPVSKGLGYSLPPSDEQSQLIERVYPILKGANRSDIGAVERDRILASVFGAEVSFVVRKREDVNRLSSVNPNGASRGNRSRAVKHNGVHFAFSPSLARLLLEQESLLPNLQTDDVELINQAFDPASWHCATENRITTVTLCSQPGTIQLPASPGPQPQLLVLRFYGQPPEEGACSLISVLHDGKEVFSFQVWQPESFLCVVQLESGPPDSVRPLQVKCTDDQGTALNLKLNVAVAGLYDLDSAES